MVTRKQYTKEFKLDSISLVLDRVTRRQKYLEILRSRPIC